LRQGLAESLLLGVLAVIGGLGVGWLLVSVARSYLPEAFLIRTLNPLDLDTRALAFTVAAGLLATIAAGLLPAWLGSRTRGDGSLRVTDRGATDTRGARIAMRVLLTTEVALACVLLVGATLLVRSFLNLTHAERGLDSKGVITATMALSGPALPDRTARVSAARSIEDQLRALPDVRQVAWSYGLPPDGGAVSFGEWKSDDGRTVDMVVERYNVGPDFFSLYGIPLLRGRSFDPSDAAGAVIVGERFAKALWPGVDPLGRTGMFLNYQFHVIGIAREINHPSLDPRVDRPEFYELFGGVGTYAMLSLRCDESCPEPAVIRQRIALGHPAARVVSVRPLDDEYFEQLARPRAAAALALVFAIIATLAAAGGLFSVLSYGVARRLREFGIRTALGASASQIGALVVRDGLVVALTGLGIGGVTAWSMARVFSSLQYGVTLGDPVSWALVLSVLAVTTLVASWRPARHAMLVSPVLLLKEE
jgi:putative ABC transport system permease protein